MNHIEHTKENIEKLVSSVTNFWDLDTLLLFAGDRLEADYVTDRDLFYEDWQRMFGEEK